MQNPFLWISVACFLSAFVLLFAQKQTRFSLLSGAVSIVIYTTLCALYEVADYFTGEGINDAFIFHFVYGVDGVGIENEYYFVISIALVFLAISFILALVYYYFLKRKQRGGFSKTRLILSRVFLIIAFLSHPSIFWLYDVLLAKVGYEDYLANQYKFIDYYQMPKIVSKEVEHLNLVHIYAESLEFTYFDENIFPSLIKDLRALQRQSINFTNIQQVVGTGWTIAGLTAALCGIPLVTPSTTNHTEQANSMSMMSRFYSGATCISDLLRQEGYKMIYRSGSDTDFAGVAKLYKTHQFNEVRDLKMMIQQSPVAKEVYEAYHSPWGYYDDTLFDMSFSDFEELSKSNQKFMLFISTIDTHAPSGRVPKTCKRQSYNDGSNVMLNAVACSDELIANFIKKIQASPYSKNTIIVVSSDHLAMNNMASKYLERGKRRNQLMIIDPRKTQGQTVDKMGTTLDISTTLMPLLGYDVSMGLGRNLLSKQESLISQLPTFNKVLKAWSNNIEKFWEFSKIQSDISLDLGKKLVSFGQAEYVFPIILRLNQAWEVNPFFELEGAPRSQKLYEDLKRFNYDTPFVWIDVCSRVETLDEAIDKNSKWCIAYGKLGADIKVKTLEKNTSLSLKELDAAFLQKTSEQKANQQRSSLDKIKKEL